jgi:hypothetical protein
LVAGWRSSGPRKICTSAALLTSSVIHGPFDPAPLSAPTKPGNPSLAHPLVPLNKLGLDELRAKRPPQGPLGFDEFWRTCYLRVLGVNPQPRLGESGSNHSNWRVHDILYTSTDEFQIVTDTLLLTVASP